MPWFVGPYLLKFIKGLQENCPSDEDTLHLNRKSSNRRLQIAGSAYQEARLWSQFGKHPEAETNWQRFVKEWLDR